MFACVYCVQCVCVLYVCVCILCAKRICTKYVCVCVLCATCICTICLRVCIMCKVYLYYMFAYVYCVQSVYVLYVCVCALCAVCMCTICLRMSQKLYIKNICKNATKNVLHATWRLATIYAKNMHTYTHWDSHNYWPRSAKVILSHRYWMFVSPRNTLSESGEILLRVNALIWSSSRVNNCGILSSWECHTYTYHGRYHVREGFLMHTYIHTYMHTYIRKLQLNFNKRWFWVKTYAQKHTCNTYIHFITRWSWVKTYAQKHTCTYIHFKTYVQKHTCNTYIHSPWKASF
jgi:hypothetical protein